MKTNDEINRMITERLFDGECWHEFDIPDDVIKKRLWGYGHKKCVNCGKALIHASWHDFCGSDTDIRAARERIAEKGLQVQFINALEKEVLKTRHSAGAFYLMQSSPEVQARAIVRVLEGLE